MLIWLSGSGIGRAPEGYLEVGFVGLGVGVKVGVLVG